MTANGPDSAARRGTGGNRRTAYRRGLRLRRSEFPARRPLSAHQSCRRGRGARRRLRVVDSRVARLAHRRLGTSALRRGHRQGGKTTRAGAVQRRLRRSGCRVHQLPVDRPGGSVSGLRSRPATGGQGCHGGRSARRRCVDAVYGPRRRHHPAPTRAPARLSAADRLAPGRAARHCPGARDEHSLSPLYPAATDPRRTRFCHPALAAEPGRSCPGAHWS